MMIEAPDFWDKPDSANKIVAELSSQKQTITEYSGLLSDMANQLDYVDLLLEEKALDENTMAGFELELNAYTSKIDEMELKSLLNGEYDSYDAIFSINAGAGGTDAQDWAEMMLRMYTRFFERQNYSYEIIDYSAGDEAGLKGVTLVINGLNAYGYLKNELGIHRLVRISPFNANGKRQTSFASVDVIPKFNSDVSVDINTDELKIDTYRASGAGGQHINKTDSAVRITHIPSGVVVQCQAGRSQNQNKDIALGILQSRLYQIKLEEQKDSIDQFRGEKKEIGWGNQIRSYVFHPYNMVKDHRTKHERNDVNNVMDGDIMGYIESYLRFNRSK